MSTIELHITGMSCNHCVRATTAALQAVAGVSRVEVALPDHARIEGDADPAVLLAAVQQAGYQARLRD